MVRVELRIRHGFGRLRCGRKAKGISAHGSRYGPRCGRGTAFLAFMYGGTLFLLFMYCWFNCLNVKAFVIASPSALSYKILAVSCDNPPKSLAESIFGVRLNIPHLMPKYICFVLHDHIHRYRPLGATQFPTHKHMEPPLFGRCLVKTFFSWIPSPR